jgi:hypothetical protein
VKVDDLHVWMHRYFQILFLRGVLGVCDKICEGFLYVCVLLHFYDPKYFDGYIRSPPRPPSPSPLVHLCLQVIDGKH